MTSPKRVRIVPFALMLALVELTIAAPAVGQEVERLSGDRVAIFNLAGQVEVVAGNGPDVVVEITRGGSDADRLGVEVGQVDGRTALRVLYPDDRVVYGRMSRGSNTQVRVRDDGTFGGGRRGGEQVRISGRGSGLEAHADMRISVPDGVDLAVFIAAGEGTARDLRADLTLDLGSGTVDVARVVGNVRVDTGSGAVALTGVEGDVSADTGSGTIELRDLVGDRIDADTGSGRIEGEGIRARAFNADTGSGRISIESLEAAEIVCDTGSGSVSLDLVTDVDLLEVDTGSGSVRLTVPDNLGASLEIDTGSGGIDVDVPVTVARARRDYLRGTLGDGEGRIVIDTGSGGIDIRAR